jgi:hypothetical protein
MLTAAKALELGYQTMHILDRFTQGFAGHSKKVYAISSRPKFPARASSI